MYTSQLRKTIPEMLGMHINNMFEVAETEDGFGINVGRKRYKFNFYLCVLVASMLVV